MTDEQAPIGPIDSFEGEYRWLSNFWPGDVRYEGLTYPTVEHAFQAAKTHEKAEREKIRDARSAGSAKALGRKVKLHKDWESVKIDIMRTLVRIKFTEPELAQQLLATAERELIEGNSWNDRFWGVCGGEGKNWLGRILMEVRAELRQA